MTPDLQMPAFLGRVLGADDGAIGTYFQVMPGIIVTAFHVLADLGCDYTGAQVSTDALAGDTAVASAKVLAVDPDRDLAVLRRTEPLADVVAGLAPSIAVRLRTEAYVAGVSHVNDEGHQYRYLTATGMWQGLAQRDGIDLGRFTSTAVLPGMSGAPVIRIGDDAVLGVVSGRYNSADHWLRDSIWVTCAENIASLLAGIPGVALHRQLIIESGRPSTLLTLSAAGTMPPDRDPKHSQDERSVGPQEAAFEAAMILLSLHDSCRSPGPLMEVVTWLTVQAALAGNRGVAGARGFREWIRIHGLDPRILIAGLPRHQEALRRWTAPLSEVSKEYGDLIAMLTDFTRVLFQQLDEDLFTNTSNGCRSHLKAAMSGDRSASTSRFLKAFSERMPSLTSTELVAVSGTAPTENTSPAEGVPGPISTENTPSSEEDDRQRGSDSPHQYVLNAVAQRMCRLPEADPFFIGRDDLVSRISISILETMTNRQCAVAFLAGQPGVGTSEVAIAVARNLSAEFPGGALYINLHGLTPDSRRNPRTVVRILSEALRLDIGSVVIDDAEAFDRFIAQLSDCGVLIVLDNAADASHIALLARHVHSCAFIVTSRDRLQDLADPGLQFDIKALDRTDSVELLSMFTGNRKQYAAYLNGIAALCDDVPLALRMIGARIASDPHLSLSHLLGALEREITRLDYLQVGTRAVRAAIALSYAMLEPDGRRALRLMSAFPGFTVTARSLGHCAESDQFRQELTLYRLADRNLAWHTNDSDVPGIPQAQFALFELIRIFAGERLLSEDTTAEIEHFQLRAINYLRDRLVEINNTAPDADISGELDPRAFHAAEHLAEVMNQLDVATDLALNLWTLYSARREVDSLVAINAVRIGLYLRRADPENAAKASMDNADILLDMKALRHAEDSYRETVRISEAYGLPLLRAKSMFKLSTTLGNQERWQEALEFGECAVSVFYDLERSAETAPACINNARFAARLDDPRKALYWGRRAAAETEKAADQRNRAHAALEMTDAHMALGDYGAALETSLLGERLSEGERQWWNAAINAKRAAVAAVCLDDIGTALNSINRAIGYLASSESDHAPAMLVETLIDLSSLQILEGQFDGAESALQQAEENAREAGSSVSPLTRREIIVRATALRSFVRWQPYADLSIAILAIEDGEGEESTDPVLEEALELLAAWNMGSLPDARVWPEIFRLLMAMTRNKSDGPALWLFENLAEDSGPRLQLGQ